MRQGGALGEQIHLTGLHLAQRRGRRAREVRRDIGTLGVGALQGALEDLAQIPLGEGKHQLLPAVTRDGHQGVGHAGQAAAQPLEVLAGHEGRREVEVLEPAQLGQVHGQPGQEL